MWYRVVSLGLALPSFLLAIALSYVSEPAYGGFFGDVVRRGMSIPLPGGGGGGGGSTHHHHNGNADDGSSSSNSDSGSGRKSKSFTEAVRDANNFWAKQEEDAERERANKLERQRNVDKAIEKFIETLREYHNNLRQRATVNGSLLINQVTAGELKASLEDAYRQGHLVEFERHVGELWTRDRLMVLTLRYAEEGLKPYFDGVGAKGPSVDEIKSLLSKSARDVHATALEIGEMVGVSLSFDRFIRTIYENSDRADEGLWAKGADGKYERLGTALIDTIPREKFISKETLEADPLGLEKQFLYRFRARRTLYDCLTSRYPDFMNSKGMLVSAGGAGNAGGASAQTPGKGFVPEVAPKNDLATSLISTSRDGSIWLAASGFIDRYCRSSTVTVASLVVSGKLQPESARMNTANMTNGFGAIDNGNSNDTGASTSLLKQE